MYLLNLIIEDNLATANSCQRENMEVLYNSEIDVATTGDILGHEDYETTRIYSHTYKEQLKRAVNRVRVG